MHRKFLWNRLAEFQVNVNIQWYSCKVQTVVGQRFIDIKTSDRPKSQIYTLADSIMKTNIKEICFIWNKFPKVLSNGLTYQIYIYLTCEISYGNCVSKDEPAFLQVQIFKLLQLGFYFLHGLFVSFFVERFVIEKWPETLVVVLSWK